jgi:hypothetical protein
MRTDGMLLVAMLVLMLLACPVAYGQAGGARQEASLFEGWTFG